MKKSKKGKTGGALVLMGAFVMLPLITTITNSYMTEREIALNYSAKLTYFDLDDAMNETFRKITFIPNPVTLSQYAAVLVYQPSFLLLLLNSLKITAPVTAGTLIIALLTAYGFTVSEWKHKEKAFMAYIVVMLMPLQAVIVPNYIIAELLGIPRSYLAIILPGVFSPFGVFLMRQNMKALPFAYIEAARMDGANDITILIRIIMPNMKSSIAALCMLTFIEYWNTVEQAIVFIDDYTKEPLSIYLSRIADTAMGLIFAASCVYMAPPLWFLFSGQEHLEKGIELSGVK
ncbi:MAG: carbohydrate ABC transporter permease [Treponema sp.]|jgi:multiple sugar transport system permease protein|nr:carbohydrate ABC transporter permease [Treponema sp.]